MVVKKMLSLRDTTFKKQKTHNVLDFTKKHDNAWKVTRVLHMHLAQFNQTSLKTVL